MDSLKHTDLSAGDVLLYHTDVYFPGKLIQYFDDSEWYHSGLFIGLSEGSAYRVAEGVADGVVVQDLKQSVKDSNKILVRRLKEQVPTMEPVLLEAENYVGSPYAFHDLFFLAIICLFREVEINDPFNAFLRNLLELASSDIDKVIAAGVDKQPMICSSFVYRSYNDAIPAEDDPYTIRILKGAGTYATRLFSDASQSARLTGFTKRAIHSDCVISQIISELSKPTGDVPWSVATDIKSSQIKIDKAEKSSATSETLQQYFQEYHEWCDKKRETKYYKKSQGINIETVDAVREFSQKLGFKSAAIITKQSLDNDPGRTFPSGYSILGYTDPLISSLCDFKDAFANFVTPKDLSLSDDLVDVGILESDELAKLK